MTAVFALAFLCLVSVRVAQAGQDEGQAEFVVLNDSSLPETFPHAEYEVRLRARGGTPAFHWRVVKGSLPPGMKLTDEGVLRGQADHSGEFNFKVEVRDGSAPEMVAQKDFVLRVVTAFRLSWKNEAHVRGNRIEGSADVSNTTGDDIDLTFIVLAVPSNGRAVAIGYQHFLLRTGTMTKELPFGETLPHGGYVVHVDAIGEVAAKKAIYRERLQTPTALEITVGP